MELQRRRHSAFNFAWRKIAMMWGYGPDSGMMGWSYGAFGVFHMILWIVIVGSIIAAVIWFVRAPGANRSFLRPSSGLQVLEERYARGEINRDEYLQKKEDICANL
jgi:putative membrane protein